MMQDFDALYGDFPEAEQPTRSIVERTHLSVYRQGWDSCKDLSQMDSYVAALVADGFVLDGSSEQLHRIWSGYQRWKIDHSITDLIPKKRSGRISYDESKDDVAFDIQFDLEPQLETELGYAFISEKRFEVEKFVDVRKNPITDELEFLVKWKDYDVCDWQPVCLLVQDVPDLVSQEFINRGGIMLMNALDFE